MSLLLWAGMMPLLDHFHPPVMDELPGITLHSSWASDIARSLTLNWLARPFRALEHVHVGRQGEIDIGAFETPDPGTNRETNGAVATSPRVWTPPQAVGRTPLAFPESCEVRVYAGPGRWNLVGAIELVSRSNKDRPGERCAFVDKCASYLHTGVSVVIIDVVTSHDFALHNQLLDRLGIEGEYRLAEEVFLYAARPLQHEDRAEVEVWREPCRVGEPLPTMPLRLAGDLFVPIEIEATYTEKCRSHWL